MAILHHHLLFPVALCSHFTPQFECDDFEALCNNFLCNFCVAGAGAGKIWCAVRQDFLFRVPEDGEGAGAGRTGWRPFHLLILSFLHFIRVSSLDLVTLLVPKEARFGSISTPLGSWHTQTD